MLKGLLSVVGCGSCIFHPIWMNLFFPFVHYLILIMLYANIFLRTLTASKIQRGQNGADTKKLGILSLILTEIYCLVVFFKQNWPSSGGFGDKTDQRKPQFTNIKTCLLFKSWIYMYFFSIEFIWKFPVWSMSIHFL